MKKLITALFLFIPVFGFTQTVVTKPIPVKVINKDTTELDEEYKERKFQGQEETPVTDPYAGMTDHEIYNKKLKEQALLQSKNKAKVKQIPKK